MDRDTIIEDVREKAQLDAESAAERAVIETLRTFGENVSTGQAEDVADVLPDEFADAVTSRADETPPASDPDEFVAAVAEREGSDVSQEEATVHVRAVMAAVAEHGGRNELQEAREQLPDEFDTVFETDELAGE